MHLFSEQSIPYIIAAGATGFIVSLVLLMTNLEKLVDYFKRFSNWRRRRFAMKQAPVCKEFCQVASIIPSVEYLMLKEQERQIKEEEDRKAQLLRDMYTIFRICRDAITAEYMDDETREAFIPFLINYLDRNGNGPAKAIAIQALRLPRLLGGPPTVFEWADIYPNNKGGEK
jgi:hypothetical protein